MTSQQIYLQLCESSNLDAAISGLSCFELSCVAEYLSELRPTGGVPAQVWGMVSARLSAGEERSQTPESRNKKPETRIKKQEGRNKRP